MRVALVYDRVNKWGGAEQVLLALHQIWPDAPLYTAVYHPEKASWAKVFPKVIPSFLQKFPLAKDHHELYPWLTPLAFETFSFDQFDIVISVTSAEAKGIITKPKTLHICYCLTPTRYLWSGYFDYLKNPGLGCLNDLAKPFLPFVLSRLKADDKIYSQRPDVYIAISQTVQKRIKKYYQRESKVVYPPVDVNKFKVAKFKSLKVEKEDYFLIVSRLVPYKHVDLAIKVFNELGWQLKIVGTGVEGTRLKELAKNNIEFLGELTEEELLGYYQDCRALLVCGEEDFGLVSLEAQACGKPVIALNKGGAVETIINTKTGILFNQPKQKSLKEALQKFEQMKFSEAECRKNAENYSQEIWQDKFFRLVQDLWQKHQQKIIT